MTTKTANVTVRVEPEIKMQAEGIMEKLGLSASTAINMFYRQIIYQNGLPFRATLSGPAPKALDELTPAEFDAALSAALQEAQSGRSLPLAEAFDRLQGELTHE